MWGCNPSRSHLAFWSISLVIWLDLIPSWPQDPVHNAANSFTAEIECWVTFWAGGNHNPDYGIAKRSEIVKDHPFLTPSSLASPYADGEKGQGHCLFPSRLFLPSAGTLCTSWVSEHRSAWPSRRSSCPPSIPVCICEITGQNLAQKVLTTTINFCPRWPGLPEYKHLVPKGQLQELFSCQLWLLYAELLQETSGLYWYPSRISYRISEGCKGVVWYIWFSSKSCPLEEQVIRQIRCNGVQKYLHTFSSEHRYCSHFTKLTKEIQKTEIQRLYTEWVGSTNKWK